MLNSPALPKPYLNGQEAANILRISIRTLERMRVEGTGPRISRPAPVPAHVCFIGRPTSMAGQE